MEDREELVEKGDFANGKKSKNGSSFLDDEPMPVDEERDDTPSEETVEWCGGVDQRCDQEATVENNDITPLPYRRRKRHTSSKKAASVTKSDGELHSAIGDNDVERQCDEETEFSTEPRMISDKEKLFKWYSYSLCYGRSWSLLIVWAIGLTMFFEKLAPVTKKEEEQSSFAIVVIGAGAAGLSAAYRLREHGISDVIVLEASKVLGGRVRKDMSFADFPIDLGASFVGDTQLVRRIAGEEVRARMRRVPRDKRKIFVNYTWYDFLADYIAPTNPNGIVYGCQVDRVDYRGNSKVRVGCGDRTFVADYTVVTVPLSVLQDGDISFTPSLPTTISEYPRQMWKGFKIFFEFSNKFYPSSFCFKELTEDHLCEGERGETNFWDYSSVVEKNPTKHIVAGYITGRPAHPYVDNDDSQIAKKVLKLFDGRFVGKATKNYVKHLVVNWSKEPFIRGTYSDYGANETGAQNVHDNVFFAGEAFPVPGDDQGWVHSAMYSGDHAAQMILSLSQTSAEEVNAVQQ